VRGAINFSAGEKVVHRLRPFRKKRRWIYFGIAALSGLVLLGIFALPALLEPGLSDGQKQWKEFSGDGPPEHPLEVVSHGYRMIRAYRAEPKAAQGSQPRATLVEWEWKVVIKNKSGRDENVTVNYLLVDKENLPVDFDSLILPRSALAWETVTLQHKTEMIFEDLSRVATGVWEISWGGGRSPFKIKRKGF
jgi:hypothetical protein